MGISPALSSMQAQAAMKVARQQSCRVSLWSLRGGVSAYRPKPRKDISVFRVMSSAKAIGLALAIAVSVFQAVPAQAQDGRVNIKVTKAGFVVGVSGGSGTLFYKNKSYAFSVRGLKVGFTIGVASAEFAGPVYNLRRARDIAGTYTSATGSATLGGGQSSVVLENEKGVKIRLRGRQKGLEASLDVGGITIRLK